MVEGLQSRGYALPPRWQPAVGLLALAGGGVLSSLFCDVFFTFIITIVFCLFLVMLILLLLFLIHNFSRHHIINGNY